MRYVERLCQKLISSSSCLPGNFKQEFTKKYPVGNPSNMQEVYEHARTIELALQKCKDDTRKDVQKNFSTPRDATGGRMEANGSKSVVKDDKTVCWGQATRNECSLYRSKHRYFKFGVKGWSSDDHPCKERKGKGKFGDY